MTAPTIHVQDVHKRFGATDVLKSVSLDVHPGEIVGLLGPSGAGKTTLVRIIAGADVADRGAVDVAGRRMPDLKVLEQIGYMAQADALYPELSGRENLEFFAGLAGLSGRALDDGIDRAAGIVNLREHLHRPVQQYSGGMKRRLSLAIALCHAPKIVLLDEPTVGLDPLLRQEVWRELRRIADGGAAILVTTHVMDEADRCDAIAMVRHGTFIAHGSPAELKAQTGKDTLEECFLFWSRNDVVTAGGAA